MTGCACPQTTISRCPTGAGPRILIPASWRNPAEGWDARLKAYLPFYRNVALTGAYSQWYGDHVGMFGADRLEKDPKVWSYGVEYTPIPLVSGFVTQKSTERGRTDTEFGLNFTYHFGMSWEDQTSHSKVAELRTVGGSRHEFVDRENRIILEYKAKDNYHIEFVSRNGNVFTFRIKHAFDEYAAGKTVRVSASGVTTLAEVTAPKSFLARAGDAIVDFFSVSAAYAADLFQTYTTNSNGEFQVTITGLAAASTITVQAGNSSRTFGGAELGGGSTLLSLSLTPASSSASVGGSQPLTLTVLDDTSTAVSGKTVTWTWKVKGGNQNAQPGTSGPTDGSGQATYTPASPANSLQRTIEVTATVDGQTATAEIRYGNTLPGNLITGDVNPNNTLDYGGAVAECTAQGGRLPTVSELQGMTGAWGSSGLPVDRYRTGDGPSGVHDVVLMPLGALGSGLDGNTFCRVVCHAP